MKNLAILLTLFFFLGCSNDDSNNNDPIQEEQDPDHVLAAVRTGLEMLHAVELFNIELEKEGKPKEAILQYLKTVLLFDKSVGSIRQDAYKEVVGILESLKDNRAASFKARYNQEY